MIFAFVELEPNLGKRAEILELLKFSADCLKTRQGCLHSGVYEAGDEKRTILYLERWRSEKELYRHIQSNDFLAVLNAIDLSIGRHEVTFCNVRDTKSIELIEELRSASATNVLHQQGKEIL
jgi:quinol monooxygenase YgiN